MTVRGRGVHHGLRAERVPADGSYWSSHPIHRERSTVPDLGPTGAAATPGAPAFARWKQLYFSPEELGDPAISGDLADPDFDGLRNLMEYGLNLDPRTASTTGLPYFTLDSTYFSLVYPKLLAATDLTYTIEKSTDLVLWLTVTPVDQILMDDGYMRTVKAQVLRTEAGTAGQLFLRLRVTR